MGMTGFGLDLMLRALETVGIKAAPDVVVLAVYTDDFRRLLPYYSGVGYPIPKFRLEGSELITVSYPAPARWERLRIVQAVYQNYWRRVRNRYDLNRAILDRFRANADEHDFGPVVIFIPGRSDTDEDQERREWLRQWCARSDTPFLDLTEAIHGAGVENHLGTQNSGHAVVASVQSRVTWRRLSTPARS
jgi:hypothetical protein